MALHGGNYLYAGSTQIRMTVINLPVLQCGWEEDNWYIVPQPSVLHSRAVMQSLLSTIARNKELKEISNRIWRGRKDKTKRELVSHNSSFLQIKSWWGTMHVSAPHQQEHAVSLRTFSESQIADFVRRLTQEPILSISTNDNFFANHYWKHSFTTCNSSIQTYNLTQTSTP